jgi:hypothetical protein
MIRFAWLQSRTQTLVVAAALAALAVAAAITGVQLSHLYRSLVAHCQSGCDLSTGQFVTHQRFLQHALDLLAQIVPALVGIFWGAPLISRELEAGTYRLAWTQSVSRSRWVIARFAVVGLATVLLAGLLTLTITWWYRAIDTVTTNPYAVFDRRDIAPIGYAAFAFASGALIGAVVRRTLPAMASALGVYVFARVATALWVRPHLLSPLHQTVSLQGAGPSAPVHFGVASANGAAVTLLAHGSGPDGSWTLSSHLVDNSGHVPTSAQLSAFLHQYCPDVGPPPAAPPGQHVAKVLGSDSGRACLNAAASRYHLLIAYQPASRYWAFQWLETGIFVALALLAAAGCYWWVTRRTT